ncbi:hypothetical protein, partial [Klebsiella pneumoniae]|uniref:hypothetical protein n=2 Tax=Klebsiella pneumoniae TaxID=573 RepID=UPI003D16B940
MHTSNGFNLSFRHSRNESHFCNKRESQLQNLYAKLALFVEDAGKWLFVFILIRLNFFSFVQRLTTLLC